METLTANEMRTANQAKPGTFSKAEHQATPEFCAFEALWWNMHFPEAEQYTKQEHTAAPGFDAYEARCWNMWLPGAEQYTEAEISEQQLQQLLYAVETRFPGETRFETALRYIREAEARTSTPEEGPKEAK